MYDKIEHFRQVNADTVDVLKRVYELDIVSEFQKRKIFSALLRYYFDNFEGDLLDEALESIDWENVNPGDRQQYIEYCAVRHCYKKGNGRYNEFRIRRHRRKTPFANIIRLLCTAAKNEDSFMIKLAWHIFKSGKFDENVLRYICMFYNGSLADMVGIWKVAVGF